MSITAIIAMVIAYLLGSVSTSIILSKYLKFPDPREVGSGNAGATNVLRTVGKTQGLYVLLGDALKGLLAIWIGMLFGVHGIMLGFVGVAAVIGHIFPVFFGFKGGKGVATMLGVVLGLSLWAGLLSAAVWAAVVFVTRYVSFASLCAAGAAFVLSLVFGKYYYAFPILIMGALVAWRHMENIERLRAGTESKIEF